MQLGRKYRDSLNIFILAIFSTSQPIFDLLGNNVIFWITRRSDYTEIAIFAIAISIALPALPSLFCLLAYKVHRTFGRAISAVLIAGCAALFIAPFFSRIDSISGASIILLNLIFGAVFSSIYLAFRSLRHLITYLAPAILLFPIVFLANENIKKATGTDVAETSQLGVPEPTTIVVLVFDSLPIQSLLDKDKNIDTARFPNFARLSTQGTWYRNASTVNEATGWAIPSLLTGRDSYGEIPIPLHIFFPDNLFTAIGNLYELNVTEYISRLCPSTLCESQSVDLPTRGHKLSELLSDTYISYLHTLAPKEYVDSLPSINQNFGGFAKRNQTQGKPTVDMNRSPRDIAEDFISSIKNSSNPQLYFLHLLLPHAPWQYLPSGKRYGRGFYDRIPGQNPITRDWSDNIWNVNLAYQRHLVQTAFVDNILGRVVQKLETTGLYDETMLVVVADHGSSYRPGENHRHLLEGNINDIAGIPLLIKYPDQQQGSTDDRNVNITDVLPTIFDQLDIQSHWPMDGSSLLAKEFPERDGKHIRGRTGELFLIKEEYSEDSTTLDKKLSLLGAGSTSGAPFNISLEPALNGVPLHDIKRTHSDDVFSIYGLNEFQLVDPESAYLPALVMGITSSLKDDALLAVALNGNIITVTKSFSVSPGYQRFAALLPESEFRPGKNTLSIHRVEKNGESYTLYDSKIKPIVN